MFSFGLRNIARALVPEQGPEAAAIVNLNSEETRDVRGSEVHVNGVEPRGHRQAGLCVLKYTLSLLPDYRRYL